MKPAIRTQVDDRQMDFSLEAGLDTSDKPDLARQEFRDDADANLLLKRYGVNVPVQAQPQYGDADFDLDLHSAHIAVDRAQHAFRKLPNELREKYKTTQGLLDAMNSGELAKDLREHREAKERKEAAERVAKRLEEDAERARQLASDPSWAAKLAGGSPTPSPAPSVAPTASQADIKPPA